jgi:hypothetical protein
MIVCISASDRRSACIAASSLLPPSCCGTTFKCRCITSAAFSQSSTCFFATPHRAQNAGLHAHDR